MKVALQLKFSYMGHPRIPERIYHYYPDAKLIFVLCEPHHRTISHYLHMKDMKKVQKWPAFNETIHNGLETILEKDPLIKRYLFDMDRPFTEYKELRNAVYT